MNQSYLASEVSAIRVTVPCHGSGLELPDLNQSLAHVICCFDVVALEDVLRFMTRNFHSCATIHAQTDGFAN